MSENDALRGLRALASAPSPDAALIAECDRLLLLHEEVSLLYRRKGRGYMERVRQTMPERDRLQDKIAATPAKTREGRIAKAEAALRLMPPGSWCQMLVSALNDCRVADGCERITREGHVYES